MEESHKKKVSGKNLELITLAKKSQLLEVMFNNAGIKVLKEKKSYVLGK